MATTPSACRKQRIPHVVRHPAENARGTLSLRQASPARSVKTSPILYVKPHVQEKRRKRKPNHSATSFPWHYQTGSSTCRIIRETHPAAINIIRVMRNEAYAQLVLKMGVD